MPARKADQLELQAVTLARTLPLYLCATSASGLWLAGVTWGQGAVLHTTDGNRFTRGEPPPLYNCLGSGLLATSDGELVMCGEHGVVRSKKRASAWPASATGARPR